jgi:hypothetical protein
MKKGVKVVVGWSFDGGSSLSSLRVSGTADHRSESDNFTSPAEGFVMQLMLLK